MTMTHAQQQISPEAATAGATTHARPRAQESVSAEISLESAAAGHRFERIPVMRCACGAPSGGSGMPAIDERETRRVPQPKLAFSSPGDVYEREADRVASQVMSVPDFGSHAGDHGNLRPLTSGRASPAGAPPALQEILSTPGESLEPNVRSFMETRMGYDFGQVRVHADSRGSASAREMGALAYAVGTDVVFASGAYQPSSAGGRQLIAHELTHVVQQTTTGTERVSRSQLPGAMGEAGGVHISARPGGTQIQRFLSTEPAGGCGLCYGIPANAGKAAHQIIQTEFEVLYPLGLVELGITSADDDNGRLDLAVAIPGGFEIGEIKPANAQGYEDGILQIGKYIDLIMTRYPGKVVKPLTKLLPPVIFPTLSPKCPVQVLFVNPPVGGVYGYHCQPSFAALKARGCDCPIPLRRQEPEKEESESKRKEETKKKQESSRAGEPAPATRESTVKLVTEFVMIMLASTVKDYDTAARQFLQKHPEVAAFIVAAGLAVIGALIADDLSLVGIADDVAIPPILLALWRAASAL